MKKILILIFFALCAVSSFAQRKTNGSGDALKKADAQQLYASITRDSVKLTNAAPTTMIGQMVVDTLGADTMYIWNTDHYDWLSVAQAGNYLTALDSLKMRAYSNLLYSKDSIILTITKPTTFVGKLVVDTVGIDTIYFWNNTKYEVFDIPKTGTNYVFAVQPDVTGKTYSVPTWRQANGVYINVGGLVDGNMTTASGAQFLGLSWQDLSFNVTGGSFNAIRVTASNSDRTQSFSLRLIRDGIQIWSRTIDPSTDFTNNAGYLSATYSLGFSINTADGRTYKVYAVSGAASGTLRFAEIDVIGEAQVARAVVKKQDGTYLSASNNLATMITAQETVQNVLQNPNAQTIWVRNGSDFAFRQDFIGGKDYFKIDPNLPATDTFAYLISMQDFKTIAGVSIHDSLQTLDTRFVKADSLTNTVRATATASATRAASEKAVRDLFDALKLTGRTIGTAATFAALPTTSTPTGAAINGDVSWLSANDVGTGTALNPQYPKGLYVYNGTSYSLAVPVSGDILQLTDTQAGDKTSKVIGTTTGEQLYKVIEKIYDDSIKVDTASFRAFSDLKYQDKATVSTIGNIIDMTSTTAQLQTPFNLGRAIITLVAQNALSTWSPTYAAYRQGGSIEYVTRNGAIYRAASTNDIPSNTDPATDNGTNWIKMGATSVFDSVKVIQDTIIVQYRKLDLGTYSELRRDTIRAKATDLSAYALKTELKTDSVKILNDSILVQYTKTGTGLYSEFRRDTIRFKIPSQFRDTLKTASFSNDTFRLNDGGVNKLVALGLKTDSVKIVNDSILVQYTKTGNGLFTEYRRDTIRARATSQTVQSYSGLQRIEHNTTQLAITATAQTYTLTNTLQAGDLLEIEHQYNGSAAERQMFWIKVVAGTTQRTAPWPDATNNIHLIAFPTTLNNTFTIRQSTTSSSPRIISVKVWRDATNGFVVPTGTTVRNEIQVQINGVDYSRAYAGTSMRIMSAPNTGQYISSVTANNGCTAVLSDPETGAIELSVPIGTTGTVNVTTTSAAQSDKDIYIGTFENQAGDAASGGHTFTQLYSRGSRITTSNSRDFILANGVYKITLNISKHMAANTWRATSLLVGGASQATTYSGHDGSNFNGGGNLTWTVDATSANQTIQIRRTSSTGNGNAAGMITIERQTGLSIPNDLVTKNTVTVTLASGTFADGTTSKQIFAGAGEYIFRLTKTTAQVLNSVTASSGTATVQDANNGTFIVSQINGGGDITITPTLGASQAIVKVLTSVNAGVDVQVGTLNFRLPSSGNRSLVVGSATGSAITATFSNFAPSSTGGGVAGTGLVTLNLLSSGAQQYIRGYNFGAQGQVQQCLVNDQTNNRWYLVTLEIGASFNNNVFSAFEIR